MHAPARTSAIETAIRKANAAGRKALIPYLPCGFPDVTAFWTEIESLDKNGADVIEIGVPFSDPAADGPVIEAASQECLERGVTLAKILEGLKARKGTISAPIVLMGYLNPFHQYGYERFAADAVVAGVSGCIIPDLPMEESDEIKTIFKAHGLDLIPLVGLNTSVERLRAYASDASGFAYFVSVLGTTGDREVLPEEVSAKLKVAKGIFTVPLALGFGIKSPDQLAAFADSIDAVIFGSALIRHLREGKSAASFMQRWK